RRLRDAGWSGRRRDRRSRLRCQRARTFAPELRRDGLCQARYRPGQDPLYSQWPPDLPGQRSDADPGIDGMSCKKREDATRHSRLWIILVSVVFRAGIPALAKPPTRTGLFPPGAARGQSVTVTASGTFDHWPVRGWAEGTGLEIRAGS